ncbi:hypothetical protein BZG36_00066 [Bifiguratus adelaidae]|uniref:J domain-containing protein n=1 Tax=Bifiguratus adelaidae TaxID=1938954 RepID=A0A261Y8B1_9FUNG|nr:hypothetical protein BZG36_00066 [Bifiguratus adelaidae]
MAQYTYDESGVTFYYFLIAFLSLILVPATYNLLAGIGGQGQGQKTQKKQYRVYDADKNKARQRNALKERGFNRKVGWIKLLAVGAGWAIVGLLSYQVANTVVDFKVWDPYEILGVSEGISVKDIKKHYKKLSLKYHPDKAPKDQKEEFEKQFVEISKAYKVLTDDTVRKNYEEFGHPDGKQAFSMGIALPKWVVESHNNVWVLGFYALVFGIGLPYYIAKWWYRQKRYTKDKILNPTIATFFKELRDTSDTSKIVEILSASHEFKDELPVRPSDNRHIDQLNNKVQKELDTRYGHKLERSKRFPAFYAFKARTLLYTHMLRLPVTDESLADDQAFIVAKSIHLLNGMISIALARQWLETSVRVMKLSQNLVQATYFEDSPLLQLPFITKDHVQELVAKSNGSLTCVSDFVQFPEETRISVLKSSLGEDKMLDVLDVARDYSPPDVVKAVFRVAGDKIVTPGSIVTFMIKLRSPNDQKHVDEDDEDDEVIDDVDLLLQGKKKPNADPKEIAETLIHAPYYPLDKKPYWWIFLGDPRNGRIIVPPIKVTNLDPNQPIKIQFPGPPQPGTYNFAMYIISDSVVGTDIFMPLKMVVEDLSALPEEEEVDDTISEPDEDSIAGQMKLMREQGISGALSGGTSEPPAVNNDSDSDSDSD